jgi:hypothetical protein
MEILPPEFGEPVSDAYQNASKKFEREQRVRMKIHLQSLPVQYLLNGFSSDAMQKYVLATELYLLFREFFSCAPCCKSNGHSSKPLITQHLPTDSKGVDAMVLLGTPKEVNAQRLCWLRKETLAKIWDKEVTLLVELKAGCPHHLDKGKTQFQATVNALDKVGAHVDWVVIYISLISTSKQSHKHLSF